MSSFEPSAAQRSPVLLVDASLQGVQVALIDAASGTILWQGAHTENKGALEQVSQLVDTGLKATGLAKTDLVGLAAAVGPGSFTGIKVGLAFIYGLHAGLAGPGGPGSRLPLLSLSSLEAAARSLARSSGQNVTVALPATKTHGFIGVASAGKELWAGTRLVDAETPSPLAPVASDTPVFIAGQWPLLASAAEAEGYQVYHLTMDQLTALALPLMAEEVSLAWPSGFGLELPTPRYLRLSTAEERLHASAPRAEL